jgi:DNA modification methylase
MSKIRRCSTFRNAVKTRGDSLDRVSLRRTKDAGKDSQTRPIAMEWINIRELKPDPTNARKHSRQQIRKLARDIQKNSFINPILITQDGNIVAGHARFEAARLAGLSEVPVIRLTLTKAAAKIRNIWDNKSSDLSYFDDRMLGLALQELVDFNVDIEDTGFSIGEADLLIEGLSGFQSDPEDDDIPAPSGPPISMAGDVWLPGPHRILCADAQNPASYSVLMDGTAANAVFTDVPYNLAGRDISGKGKIRHRSFKMAAGEMSSERYKAFLSASIKLMAAHSVDGSLHYHCIDWRHLRILQEAADDVYFKLLNICAWIKRNGGMGSLYRSRHELVLVYKHGKGRHRNNIDLGRHGRNRTNVWEYAGGNSFSGRVTDEGNLLALHPTVKPVQLVADAILDCTERGDIVLDPFLGSGSSLIAAERVGRRCFGMDIDPIYVDVAIQRWQRHTGGHAILAATDQTFDEVAVARSPAKRGRVK